MLATLVDAIALIGPIVSIGWWYFSIIIVNNVISQYNIRF